MNDIDLIKSKLDIVDVVTSYVPELKRAGATLKARCPFHNEKTPSFSVNESLQIYKCFGCGKAGDVIKFIEEIERVDFVEALKIAADRAGVELSGNINKKDKKLEEEKHRLITANTLASQYFNYILLNHNIGEKGREYAKKRMITNQIAQKFMVGYANQSRTNLKDFLIKKSFTEKELIKWGLLVERENEVIDKFRYRLIQSIFNERGEVIGFSGRYIGKSKMAPKYLNSPETLVYKKQDILYGLYHAKESIRKQNFVIMVEGNIDILSSHRIGIENIVAPLGTAFTINQAKLIKRYCEEVYFCFDTDEAGTKALVRGIEILEEVGLRHKVIDLGDYQDADELICKNSKLWETSINNAKDSIEYLIKKFSKNLDLGTAEGKSTLARNIFPVLSNIKDEVKLNHYINELSMILDVSIDYIKNSIVKKEKTLLKHFKDNVVLDKQKERDSGLVTMDLSRQKRFLSYLIDRDLREVAKSITEEIFSDKTIQKIFINFRESKIDSGFDSLTKDLDSNEVVILKEVLMVDLKRGKSAKDDLMYLMRIITERYYDRKIKILQAKLNKDNENDELLIELDKLTKEKKKVKGIKL